MAERTRKSRIPFLKAFSTALCLLVIVMGCLVFWGWYNNAPAFKGAFLSAVPMNPLTALCLIFSACSLLMLNQEKASHTMRWVGMVLACAVLLASLLKLSEYVYGWVTGIDMWLFHDQLYTNRMAYNAALDFLLVGAGLIILNTSTTHWYHPAEYLFLGVAFMSLFALIGYIYNATSFSDAPAFYIPIALHTAMAFIFFCVAAFCARPEYGLMKTMSGDGVGSVIIRRFLPVAIVIPLGLSLVGLYQQNRGLYGPEFGMAIFTVGVIIVFTAVIWYNASLLNQADIKRKEAEEKTKEAARIKSDFASMVSHELRTPLTVIKESVAIVYDGTAGELNPDQKDFLGTAKKNVDRLARLINNVLDYQKLESDFMEFIKVPRDINQIVEEVGQSFKLPLTNKGVQLELDLQPDLPILMLDKDKIIQVLTNLINNAMKFQDKGAITLITEREGENAVKVSVKDEGIGIKEEDLDKLFKSFSQITTGTARQTGGTGLGLALSKKIVANHNGRIGVTSVYGKGSVFYFVLPVKDRRDRDKA